MNFFLERYKKWGFPQKKVRIQKTIRIQNFVQTTDAIIKSFDSDIHIQKITYLDFGYTYSAPYSLASSIQYLSGQIYIQESASQIPAQILKPTQKDRVLDICASPGSKTTQLAQLMKNKGVLVANDVEKKRIEKLCVNIERSHITNTIITQFDARDIAKIDMTFDKILVDAPCSGNFILEDDWFEKRNIEDIQKMSQLQKEILESAFSVLKKGGTLVYSTCSLEIEENEHVVEHILSKENVELLDIDISIGSEGLTAVTKKCKRLWPTETKTQGFFIAHFIKKGN